MFYMLEQKKFFFDHFFFEFGASNASLSISDNIILETLDQEIFR